MTMFENLNSHAPLPLRLGYHSTQQLRFSVPFTPSLRTDTKRGLVLFEALMFSSLRHKHHVRGGEPLSIHIYVKSEKG